ncbi:MAG: hypothetical protein U5L04_03455 [Trueperaceae bacterium]|nr:hypothetical protein [Trueperaceae bacterium]
MNTTVPNPWINLPDSAPYVLPDDASAIRAFNQRPQIKKEHRYEFTLLPEPFAGSPTAPVVVLTLNPGLNSKDFATHERPGFISRVRRSLAHELDDYPLYHFDPAMTTPASEWWMKKSRELVEEVGVTAIAKGVISMQWFPYHTEEFRAPSLRLPSQTYTFYLLHQALERQAEVVIMHSQELWFRSVPELKGYPKIHKIKNARNPTLSPGNLGDENFRTLCSRLISAES